MSFSSIIFFFLLVSKSSLCGGILVSRIPNGLASTPHQIHFSHKNTPLLFKSTVPSSRVKGSHTVYLPLHANRIWSIQNSFCGWKPNDKENPISFPYPTTRTTCQPAMLSPIHPTFSFLFSLARSLSPLAVIASFHYTCFLCHSSNWFFS